MGEGGIYVSVCVGVWAKWGECTFNGKNMWVRAVMVGEIERERGRERERERERERGRERERKRERERINARKYKE
jgi:hypothetical protein